MKRYALPLLFTTLALTACQTSSLTQEEKAPVEPTEASFSREMKEIDKSQSAISFQGNSNIIDHEGKFPVYDTEVTLDATEPANLEKAKITAEVDLTATEVDAPVLQGHLQKADFFDVENHPKATFVSTSIVSKGDNMYTVTGDLMIKGVTKSITFDAEITDAYLTAAFEVARQDFGIGNDSYGQKLLELMVPVQVKMVFMK